MTNFFWVN